MGGDACSFFGADLLRMRFFPAEGVLSFNDPSGPVFLTAVHAYAENGDANNDVLNKLVLGGRCVVCLHSGRRSEVVEY